MEKSYNKIIYLYIDIFRKYDINNINQYYIFNVNLKKVVYNYFITIYIKLMF